MESDLETILNRLRQRIAGGVQWIRSPMLYLDPGCVLHLFQELTALGEPPRVLLSSGQVITEETISFTFEPGRGASLPLDVLFQSMHPLIDRKAPFVEQIEDMVSLSHRLARFNGRLQSTRFPDGNLNLEIEFAGIRGLLFYTNQYFSSTIRPLLDHDRFHTLSCPVEVLAYVHGPVQKTIFYHQIYGDNMEYHWAPIVPMAMAEASEKREGKAS